MSVDNQIHSKKTVDARQPGADKPKSASEPDLRNLLIERVSEYAVFLLDSDGVITSWNNGAEHLYGYRRDEIVGRDFSLLWPRDDVENDRPNKHLSTVRGAGRLEEEGWRLRKDGTQFWANVVTTALFDSDGKHLGYGSLVRDFTDRRRVEWDLRAGEERLRLMVQAVKDYAIFMLDPNGNIVSWNEGAQRMNGYTADEVIGRHFSIFYTPEDIARNHPAVELEIAAREGSYEEEGRRVRKDGSRFWSSVVITAVRDDHGVLHGFAKVTRDMTERKRAAEAQVQQMRDQISRAFLRDVLFSVTEGRLRFCDNRDDLPPAMTPCAPMTPFGYDSLGTVRNAVTKIAEEFGFETTRTHDLITAVGEASMNAIVHAQTPSYQICTDDGGIVQVWIKDCGTGIEISHLHRATLERGFTTEGSLGHGFWLMLHTCDRVWLLSTSEGTTVVIEQSRDAPEPEWLNQRQREAEV